MRFAANKYFGPVLLVSVAAILFIPFIGRMHLFDWDEINFAECAREMIISKNYLTVQIDFKPFWEKPPLFIWMQVLSMKAFGINEFAARFPDALCGVLTLLVLSRIGKRIHSVRFGYWWAFIYAASVLPQLYFRSGIIDPWFNLFIFTAVWCFTLYSDPFTTPASKKKQALFTGFFIGLAVLTKGPTAFLILGLIIVVYYLPVVVRFLIGKQQQRIVQVSLTDITIFVLVALLTGGFWFILQILDGHADMVMKFILYQLRLFMIPDAGHGGHWSYHFWVLLAGVFPASVFALTSFSRNKDDSSFLRHFHLMMLILFWVVLILFSIVKTKIIHYSSLCYIPLTFFAAQSVMGLLDGKKKWHWGLNLLLLGLTTIISLVAIALPLLMKNKQIILNSGLIKDSFALANLQADVHWSGFESLIGVFLLAGIITATLLLRRHKLKALSLLFATSLLFTWLMVLVFPYKVEQYSQRSAIEFFESRARESCYVLNSGYFSYAPLFYGNKMPADVRRPMWLLTGKIDKPFYLVLKQPEYDAWKQIVPGMKVLYSKNGFVFLVRK